MGKRATKLTEEAIRKMEVGQDVWDGEVKGLGVRRLESITLYRVKVVVSKDGGKWSYKFKTLGRQRQSHSCPLIGAQHVLRCADYSEYSREVMRLARSSSLPSHLR